MSKPTTTQDRLDKVENELETALDEIDKHAGTLRVIQGQASALRDVLKLLELHLANLEDAAPTSADGVEAHCRNRDGLTFAWSTALHLQGLAKTVANAIEEAASAAEFIAFQGAKA